MYKNFIKLIKNNALINVYVHDFSSFLMWTANTKQNEIKISNCDAIAYLSK